MKFKEFDLDEQLLDAISYMGFETATPIQEQAIPEIMKGRDLIAVAQTGTGKTAAFLLPMLHKLITGDYSHDRVNTLIIVPTRELALQIDNQMQAIAYFSPVNSIAIYGGGKGGDWATQKTALTKGADVVVATPGKLISHLNMGYVKFDRVKHLILDEADRMLDMGFREDINKIVSFLPKERQNMMFSATLPSKIRQLANTLLNDPVEINIAISKPAEGVLQAAYLAHDTQKIPLVKKLIADKPNYKSILIFSSTKKKVSDLARALKGEGYTVEEISSDLEQQEREKVLLRFRAKQTRVLVATDVLSRGIDIKDINLVINFDVPKNAEDYVHRVGRTARAETTGVALTLINADDRYKFRNIEKLIEREVPKLPMPPELGEGPSWDKKGSSGGRSGGHRSGRKGGGRGRGRGKGGRGKKRN